MPQPMGFRIRLGWSGWLALVLALAIAAAIALLVLGLFIILVPVMVLGAVVHYFFPGLRRRRQAQRHAQDIVEGEYRVIDPTRLELDPPPSDRT
jgi:uncharacterized membrane protein YjjP (DUF1212 family)